MQVAANKQKALLKQLTHACKLQKISFEELPAFLRKVDAEMVGVIKQSPYIYMRKDYNLTDAKKARFCLLFRDKKSLFLYLNGDL